MTTARSGAVGYAPTVKVEPVKNKDGSDKLDKNGNLQYDVPADAVRKILGVEQSDNPLRPTYIKLWEDKERDGSNAHYRDSSPGERQVEHFMAWVNPNKGTSIIDWGCGTGRAAKKLYLAHAHSEETGYMPGDDKEPLGYDVTAVDFAYNCLDGDVKKLSKNNDRFRFVEEDITEQSNLRSEYGYCVDVMEHLMPEQIDAALTNILYASRNVYFSISIVDDLFSDRTDGIEDNLHLSVFDYKWWLNKFAEHSVIIHRSCIAKMGGNDGRDGAVIFYVTGWGDRALNWSGGKLNTDVEQIKKNIADNALLGLQPIMPHTGDGETEVMLLCGGPSLNNFEDEIKENREQGVKCVTVNGTYNWCIERNIKPSLQCMVDARDFMKRFVYQVPGLTDETKYAISSQCDPKIFEGLPKDRTYMWQTTTSAEQIPVIKENYGVMYEDWFPSPGGSTVGLRALMLLRMLGFNKIYIYGMDSCVFPERNHHAYSQPENDYLTERATIPIVVGKGTRHEKKFQCQAWQAYQAREFELMVPTLAKSGVQLQVKGDGLIAYMIQAAAKHHEDSQL